MPRAYVCIIKEKTKGKYPDNIAWSELGKQNLQAKKVCCLVCAHVISSKYSELCHVMTFRVFDSLPVIIMMMITIKIITYKAQNMVL